MDDRYVKFSVAQARRIAATVRAHEKTLKRAIPDLVQRADQRQTPNPHFAVRVYADGGQPGTATTTCSWTYRVTSLAGTHLGDAMTPDRRRIPNCPYTATPEGTVGAAYFDEAGALKLWDANELPVAVDCEST